MNQINTLKRQQRQSCDPNLHLACGKPILSKKMNIASEKNEL
jgi:hypothetical protein